MNFIMSQLVTKSLVGMSSVGVCPLIATFLTATCFTATSLTATYFKAAFLTTPFMTDASFTGTSVAGIASVATIITNKFKISIWHFILFHVTSFQNGVFETSVSGITGFLDRNLWHRWIFIRDIEALHLSDLCLLTKSTRCSRSTNGLCFVNPVFSVANLGTIGCQLVEKGSIFRTGFLEKLFKRCTCLEIARRF